MESDELWLLNYAKQLVNSDIYTARSWLLTAKTIFPGNLGLQLEEYKLELAKKNAAECSKVLVEMFRDFSSVRKLWDEIEVLVRAVEESTDPIRREIFTSLPALTQQSMILGCAECRNNIESYSKLLLLLMERFPDTVSQYGVALTERLVDTEKRDHEHQPEATNSCRSLLVRQALPVICATDGVGVSHRHFYKWLQKAIEYYACCYTCSSSDHSNKEAWVELNRLITMIGERCQWSKHEAAGSKGAQQQQLSERLSHMRELFRRSRTDVEGAVNRKQVFYSTIALLFEAASRYVRALDPRVLRHHVTAAEQASYIAVAPLDADDAGGAGDRKPESDMLQLFHVARECWTILHANENFEKDFNHLCRRWKSDRWWWLQLFLVDVHVRDDDRQTALARLKNMEARMEQDESMRPIVARRLYCHLASVLFALEQREEACVYALRCLSALKRDGGGADDTVTSSPTSSSPEVMRLDVAHVFPLVIRYLITSLRSSDAFTCEEDAALGHVLVLAQSDWPKWKPQADHVMSCVAAKSTFEFPFFVDYVINVEILEEVAFLHNRKTCRFRLLPSSGEQGRDDGTRLSEALKRNVRRGAAEDVTSVLTRYVTRCGDDVVACLADRATPPAVSSSVDDTPPTDMDTLS